MRKVWLSGHFGCSLAFAFCLVFIQSYALSSSQSPWWHWDLLAVYVFYVGLEHHTVSAASKIALASLLFESVSSIPSGFALMAHFMMMLLGNRLAVWLEMRKRGMQLLLFAFLLVSKEVMLGATLTTLGLSVDLFNYVISRLPGVAVTVVLALPLMEVLASMDGFFERRESLARTFAPRGERI